MVAPYNYLPQGQTPVQALTSGLQLGAQLAQSREAQEASRAQAELRRQQAEEIRRKVVEAEQARAARDAARSNFFKNPTPQTALEWGNTEPPAAFKEYAPFISQLTNEQAVKAATDSVRRWGLINSGRGQMVADEFLAEAEARRAAGNTQGADFSERQARLILEAPEVASTNFLTTATMTPQGRDILKAYTDAQPKTGAKAEGRTISSDADKIRAGIVDSQGKPLAGTFFQEPGKKPELVTGEKPPEKPDPGFSILSQEEAKARGLPTEGYTWQINRKTNDIGALVKPPQAAVQVNIPGQPTPPTPLETEIDKKFAPLAVDWMSGEKSLAASRINQLKAVTKILETKQNITNPVLGLTPDVVLSFVNPQSREARANAERVIQEGLRATLGAQFTQREGEAFLRRAYDPSASQADNLRRLKAVLTQMTEAAKDRDAMLKYVQGPGKGSLKGYTGRIPSMSDYYAAIEDKEAEQPAAAAAAAPAATPRSPTVDALLEKYKTKPGGR